MGQPAVVMGDQITGMCATHQIPSPSGAPMPSPAPLPFAAPITTGCDNSVLIGGQPAAVDMSEGINTSVHVGLHASDPYVAANLQKGVIVKGSSTVLVGGKGLAYTGCQTSICFQMPGQIVGSQAMVLVGG